MGIPKDIERARKLIEASLQKVENLDLDQAYEIEQLHKMLKVVDFLDKAQNQGSSFSLSC